MKSCRKWLGIVIFFFISVCFIFIHEFIGVNLDLFSKNQFHKISQNAKNCCKRAFFIVNRIEQCLPKNKYFKKFEPNSSYQNLSIFQFIGNSEYSVVIPHMFLMSAVFV